MAKKSPGSAPAAPTTFPIVAVGGAEGGIEAFKRILQTLQEHTVMAWVFVQHLAPRLSGTLAEGLSRHTRMPVVEATPGLRVEPGKVYLIPARANLTIERGILAAPDEPPSGRRAPIDRFFRSLAADRGSSGIGVLLSGAVTDGTAGMLAIKAAGGITFTQDADSAAEPAMPRSAVATGCVDFILQPEEIALEIARLVDHPYVASATIVDEDAADAQLDATMMRILALVQTGTGVDFSNYKQATIYRRILRRMALGRVETMEAYLQRLRGAPAEIVALHEDFLIHVTRFFREPDAFEALKELVFPGMLANRTGSMPMRIWVPGCSSGEEVYSLAIALLEHLADVSREASMQFFGTDINESALEKARYGLYLPGIAEDVSPERLRRFFTPAEGGYRISQQIREMCVYARHNVVQDPPFSRLDFISCRNVLIYLGRPLQKRVLPFFHYALKPGGFLLLGSSETIGSFGELFAAIDKRCKIFSRNATPRRFNGDIPPMPTNTPKPPPARPDGWSDEELAREVDREMLARYAPPGVIIDDNLNILQFRGRTSPWLEPAAGTASLNLLRMARDGLALELRKLVQEARNTQSTARREGLRSATQSADSEFAIEVVPIRSSPDRQSCYLILFEPAKRPEPARATGEAPPETAADKFDRENALLRRELASAREYLQSIIEEQAAFNARTRSAGDELSSTNEKLQGINEEPKIIRWSPKGLPG